MPRKKSQHEIISEFRKVHGDRYDYSLVEFAGSTSKVKIICPVHGMFEIAPGHHKNGVGCRKCFFVSQKISKEEFIARAQCHFGARYDYAAFEDIPGVGTKIRIHCREHDETFFQEPRNHMQGHVGCPRCKSLKLSGSRENIGTVKSEVELNVTFVTRAREIHGEKYDYREFRYVTVGTKGKITCPRHGAFWQSPNNHLRGRACPACSCEGRQDSTFKKKCKDLGVNYWRALKRRKANHPEDQILVTEFLPKAHNGKEISVFGVKYASLEQAVKALAPPSSSTTIKRWLKKGMTPEEAFERIANPGYAVGIIYLITHGATGKKYVGLTVQTLDRRWQYHIENAATGRIKGADSLHAAIREYGPNAFEIRQIDAGITKKDLEKKERYWIKTLEALVPHGYNISRGGVSGGSNRKPVVVDGVCFQSVDKAAEHISITRGINIDAAKWRLRKNRVDVRTPAKPGESLVKTQAYKAWSRIVHGVLNPKTKEYIPGIELFGPWRNFDRFFRDVGQPPAPNMAFTRLDKSKGFFPDNCTWLSKSEASRINANYMKSRGMLIGRRAEKKNNSRCSKGES